VGLVYGRFNAFDAEIVMDETDPAASHVSFVVDAASVDTGNTDRDDHLRSADFFKVDEFPEITFTSTAVEHISEDTYRVTGQLAMLGVEREVTTNFTYNGTVQDDRRGTVAGYLADLTVMRSDFGMDYGLGGIGDEVNLIISVQAIKQ
jgi:polyisoprenoid-binding protein YceI